jgi:hypothetical protein
MEGAKQVSCSGFGDAIIDDMNGVVPPPFII